MRNLTGSPPYGGVNGNRVLSYNLLKNPVTVEGGKNEIIITENIIQTWNLMDLEDSLKMHALSDNQDEITGFRQLFTKTKLNIINRSLK